MSFGADFATYFMFGMIILIVVLLLSLMRSLRRLIIKILLPLTIFWLYGVIIFSIYPSIASELGILPYEARYDALLLGFLLIGFAVIQIISWLFTKGMSYQNQITREKRRGLEKRKVEKRTPKPSLKEKRKHGS